MRMNLTLLLLGIAVFLVGCNNSTQDQPVTTPSGVSRGPGGPGGPGGRGGFGGGGAMGILMIEEAQTALGITEEQMQKLQEAGQAMFANMPRPGQGQMPDPTQMREQMQKIQTESRKNLESILSADQVAKLDVMVFQRSGGLNPPVPAGDRPGAGFGGGITIDTLRALDLTDDQKEKAQEAVDQRMETTSALGPAGGGPNLPQLSDDERAARREATQKINDEFSAAVNAVLTDDQKIKAEELMKDVPEYLQRPARGSGGPGGR